MRMRRNLFWLIVFFIYVFPLRQLAVSPSAVTYELSPGRFGDNLVSYIHAKWISYKYNLPLLYKPFIYSDCLLIHEYELFYTESIKKNFGKTIFLGGKTSVNLNDTSSVLYMVPYFPESKYELAHGVSFTRGPWKFFDVDWNDRAFIDELKKVIAPAPSVTILPMSLPNDRISVAVHLRRGGNHDTPETLVVFPLKFLSDDFYISQIKNLYSILNKRPLYVYLFTDDNNPVEIMDKFKTNLQGFDIQLDCRKQKNSDTTNVIEDFFTLKQFDCLIHSESNFSLIMGKIAGYLISIYPDSFRREKNKVVYDRVNVTVDSTHKKFAQIALKKPKDGICHYEFLIKN